MGTRRRLIVSLAAALFVLPLACKPSGVERDSPGEGGDLPVQETKVRKWVEYRGGKMVWEFRGDVVRYFQDPERVEADGVVIDFYDDGEEYASTLTAASGSIDRGTSDMTARGNVVVDARNGTRLESEMIRWDDEKEIITTDEFVTIIRGKRRITGWGLRADPALEDTEILRDVVAFTVEGDGGE
ncbi:MAG: LPS export ABC transporter periplasmic protein LptC [Candidatus Eisenbacteria bacterium]